MAKYGTQKIPSYLLLNKGDRNLSVPTILRYRKAVILSF